MMAGKGVHGEAVRLSGVVSTMVVLPEVHWVKWGLSIISVFLSVRGTGIVMSIRK